MMHWDSRRGQWTIVAGVAALLAALATRQALQYGWEALRDDSPPLNPDDYDTQWTEALIWCGITGFAAGVARVVARRGASTGWRLVTGTNPPKTKKDVG